MTRPCISNPLDSDERIYVIHRHGGWWHDPEAFDPDRFSAERQAARPRFAYIPFGGGPRLCIGQHMALFEAHLILAMAAQRYRLSMLTEQPVAAESLVTLRPRGGLWMTVQARRSG